MNALLARASSIRTILSACALVLLFDPRAFAQDKPALAVKTRTVEIEVHIDKTLRKFPDLHKVLLEDAKRFVDEHRAEAEAAWREDRNLFRIGPWTFEQTYGLDAEAGPYVGVSVLTYWFTGGAHPNSVIGTILWHRGQHRRASIAEFFKETRANGPTLSALAKLVREGVAAEKRERGADVEDNPAKDSWLEPIQPKLDALGAPGLVPSTIAGKLAGLDFHFSPYDVGPYAEGFYSAFVPWQSLAPYLTEEARTLFGGERPPEGPTKP